MAPLRCRASSTRSHHVMTSSSWRGGGGASSFLALFGQYESVLRFHDVHSGCPTGPLSTTGAAGCRTFPVLFSSR
eukprot:CAMPEP_0202819238 /NCGR_PEP_ID=MMETSP1389-20130828/8950_1 /ASSEMBLY_ACC=CAM_ASM_000865 /TAXON_ID=302021 /ORGANISM="Rhodomonas sp., Strain CCMP768" /LENGTH=74 /DNA_ID=CAMNT_0049491757 /DNA_START=65 /DNA_END=286 /DNA_ORIENTATION=-